MLKAREVFNDCKYAVGQLQHAVDEERLEDAKLFWFATVTMLRTIGHVLDKVDRKAHGIKFSERLDQSYKLWKVDPVFRDFIYEERNNIVKEYISSLEEETNKEDGALLLESGDYLLLESGGRLLLENTVTRLVKAHGKYAGSSPAAALSQALAWWDKELIELEQII